MSVPLDNLYHWIESLLPAPAIMYLFYPHGSKKISDFTQMKVYNFCQAVPGIIVHDQEPLDWELYDNPKEYIASWKKLFTGIIDNDYQKITFKYCANFNLKSSVLLPLRMFDKAILVHSEKNSTNLIKYQNNGFICVHYWAHAVIAKDWYRFAEHDERLQTITNKKNKFLIYCRDWSNSREYRLKFLEMLIEHNLNNVSQISIMHTNSEGTHFLQHQFKTDDFQLIIPELIEQIPSNLFSSTASANYEPTDFTNSEISIVLETVFDNSAIHLTEKTLRPIACGHPFILAAGPGALEYIRSYGFKTFTPWIDESYDKETNSFKRLEKIIKSMKQIQNLQGQELENFSRELKRIAVFNKNHFFSNEFFYQVRDELKNNLDSAYKQVKQTRGKHYLELLKLLKIKGLAHHVHFRREKTQLLRQLRQSYRLDQSNPQKDPPV